MSIAPKSYPQVGDIVRLELSRPEFSLQAEIDRVPIGHEVELTATNWPMSMWNQIKDDRGMLRLVPPYVTLVVTGQCSAVLAHSSHLAEAHRCRSREGHDGKHDDRGYRWHNPCEDESDGHYCTQEKGHSVVVHHDANYVWIHTADIDPSRDLRDQPFKPITTTERDVLNTQIDMGKKKIAELAVEIERLRVIHAPTINTYETIARQSQRIAFLQHTIEQNREDFAGERKRLMTERDAQIARANQLSRETVDLREMLTTASTRAGRMARMLESEREAKRRWVDRWKRRNVELREARQEIASLKGRVTRATGATFEDGDEDDDPRF